MRVGRLVAAAAATIIFALSAFAAPEGEGRVKVFILAGQSNMEGAGAIRGNLERNGGKGSLECLLEDPATADRFKHLVDDKGDWVIREDVWIWYLDRQGGLTVGYGARDDRIGPELQFGHVVGDRYEDQVLQINIAWGGKSLAEDYRSPSNGAEVGPCYEKLFHERVLITPHTSSHAELTVERRQALFEENLRRFSRGEPLLNVVDRRAGY